MAGITLEIAKEHLNTWLKAELNVSTNQSYQIGTRMLTRANLKEIRNTIKFWEDKIAQIEIISNRRGRNRVYRAVPRDL